jgi:hypothetical protein
MQIIHRISINATPQIRRELAAIGLLVGSGDPIASNVVTFEVDEADEEWDALRVWIVEREALDVVTTKFSRKDIQEAAWLELEPNWHWGYPQPEDGYKEATYDLSEYCKHCGIGMKQKASFCIRGEPKWGRNGILQLNWVFDEYFVTPEVWARVFEPVGVQIRPVLSTKGTELKTVVQLVIDEKVGIATEGLAGEYCPSCQRKKYLPVTRGWFPPLRGEPALAIAKSEEYFGSGASAHRAVLVSRSVADAMATDKIRGASVRPVARV